MATRQEPKRNLVSSIALRFDWSSFDNLRAALKMSKTETASRHINRFQVAQNVFSTDIVLALLDKALFDYVDLSPEDFL